MKEIIEKLINNNNNKFDLQYKAIKRLKDEIEKDNCTYGIVDDDDSEIVIIDTEDEIRFSIYGNDDIMVAYKYYQPVNVGSIEGLFNNLIDLKKSRELKAAVKMLLKVL